MKVKQVVNDSGMVFGFCFYCPGCKMLQIIPTETIAGDILWRFNHSMDKPTFSPSLQTHWGSGGKLSCCHAQITQGRIEFFDDCSHALAGQTVDLPELEDA